MSLQPQFGGLIPSQAQEILNNNYLQWTNNGGAAGIPNDFVDFAQQYLPEVYEQEVERYGNRTLSGFGLNKIDYTLHMIIAHLYLLLEL